MMEQCCKLVPVHILAPRPCFLYIDSAFLVTYNMSALEILLQRFAMNDKEYEEPWLIQTQLHPSLPSLQRRYHQHRFPLPLLLHLHQHTLRYLGRDWDEIGRPEALLGLQCWSDISGIF